MPVIVLGGMHVMLSAGNDMTAHHLQAGKLFIGRRSSRFSFVVHGKPTWQRPLNRDPIMLSS